MKNKFGSFLKHLLLFLLLFAIVSGFYFIFLVRFPSIETKRIENIYVNQAQQFANLLSEWVAPDLFLLDQFILQKKLKNAFINNGISRILIFNPQGEIITDTKDTRGRVKSKLYSKAIVNRSVLAQKNMLFYEVVVPIYAVSEMDNTNLKDNILGYLAITYKEPVISQLNLAKLYENEGIYLSFLFSLVLYLFFLVFISAFRQKLPQRHINNIPEKLNQKGIESHLISRIEQDELLNPDMPESFEGKNVTYNIFVQFEQHFTDLIESFVDLGETVKNLQSIKNMEFPSINLTPIANFVDSYSNIYQSLVEVNKLPSELKASQHDLAENIEKAVSKMPDLVQTVAILKKISAKLILETNKLPDVEKEELIKTAEEIRMIAESLIKQGKILEENVDTLKEAGNKFTALKLDLSLDFSAIAKPDEVKATCRTELNNIEEVAAKLPLIMGTLKKYVLKLQVFNKEISKKARENLLELTTFKERL